MRNIATSAGSRNQHETAIMVPSTAKELDCGFRFCRQGTHKISVDCFRIKHDQTSKCWRLMFLEPGRYSTLIPTPRHPIQHPLCLQNAKWPNLWELFNFDGYRHENVMRSTPSDTVSCNWPCYTAHSSYKTTNLKTLIKHLHTPLNHVLPSHPKFMYRKYSKNSKA